MLLRSRLLVALAVICLGPSADAKPDAQEAELIFAEARGISDRDAGKLWGVMLYGPMLLVDPRDRAVIANQQDAGRRLALDGGVFTGTLTDDAVLADTPSEWMGTRWTQLLMPMSYETARRRVTLAHELFHRVQPSLGLARGEADNGHLDSFMGRYLIQLEWRALARALSATRRADRLAAIADALLFRAERYRIFPAAASSEASLEINEGVPQYTGVMLGLETPRERLAYAMGDLWGYSLSPSFVRSFAYAHGAAYGLLLDEFDPAWKQRIKARKAGSDDNFGQVLKQAANVPAPNLKMLDSRIRLYDDGVLRAGEQAREDARVKEMAGYRAALIDGPVLTLPLAKRSMRFNPQNVRALPGVGTIYPVMDLRDRWGLLKVTGGGVLISSKTASVSARGIGDDQRQGPGWTLELAPGWKVVPGTRNGDWMIVEADPALEVKP